MKAARPRFSCKYQKQLKYLITYCLFSLITLYVPTILMTIVYMLIYYQLERLFTQSRIRSSSANDDKEKRFSRKKLTKWIKNAFWVLLSLFVVSEFLLSVLLLFNLIHQVAFQIQITVLTTVFILFANLSMLALYCSYTGQPYISNEYYKNVKHCAFVAVYWTFAFILKLIAANFDRISLSATNSYSSTENGEK